LTAGKRSAKVHRLEAVVRQLVLSTLGGPSLSFKQALVPGSSSARKNVVYDRLRINCFCSRKSRALRLFRRIRTGSLHKGVIRLISQYQAGNAGKGNTSE
jgi:hypothetical protein